MSRAKQKELQLLKELKEKKENEYRTALKRTIDGDETLRISLDYAEKILNTTPDEALEEYSPTHISRLVFEKELGLIEAQFEKLPDGECRVEHFIAIMLKVMKFPFQKVPLYMVGLKDMFYQVADEIKEIILFPKLFQYIVGELVTLREQQQNTEFQVHFEETKKQDYLLHDNGIKRTLYSADLKVVMSLDDRQNMIKFYDQDMRNTHRLQGRKELHGGKNPMVLDFDYSEMTMRLGVIFPDAVLQCIHLPNFLNKIVSQFEQSSLNQLSFTMCCRMKRIYYIQMLNKWLAVSEDGTQVFLYDMEKARSKPEEVEQRISIDNNDLAITMVMQIVALSTICFVAGNEITFYNQSLTEKKFSRFSHHQIITNLKYSEQNNTFYLSGKDEKTITMFTISRGHQGFKIRSFSINKIIADFEVFPHFETILISDETHELRLIHEPTKSLYQQQSFANIVKTKEGRLAIQKISKTQLILFQTYMVQLGLQKVAMQRQVEYTFLPYFHFDARKDELYLSVNNQILSFSLIYGQMRKSYSGESSNITNHNCFFLGSKTKPFILDNNYYLYQIFMRGQQLQGENRSYTKKVGMRDMVAYFYDEQMRSFMMVNDCSVQIIRNDYNNNFNTVNAIHLNDIAKITNCTFCRKTKYLTFMANGHTIYQLKNFENHFSRAFRVHFPRIVNEAEQRVIIQHEYCSHYQLLIMLNNRNQIVIAERLNISNHVLISLDEHLPYKLKSLSFTRFTYHLLKEKNTYLPSILLYDDLGFVIDLNLHKLIYSKFSNTRKEEVTIKPFICESYEIKTDSLKVEEITVNPESRVKLNPGDFWVQKGHDKQIVIGTKLYLQIPTILTISKDGIIKLWSQKYSLLFVIKIPSLLKLVWNMKQIQGIKNDKSINEVRKIISQHYSSKQYKDLKPIQTINKIKKIKNVIQPIKKFKFSQDVPLELQSKEIEDIVMQEEDYRKSYHTYRGLKSKLKFNPELSNTIDVHPWRTRREFIRLYEKASPPKYAQKIPKDLLSLRTSLDMSDRKKKTPNYKLAQSLLPQLRNYESEKVEAQKQGKKQVQKQDVQNFESCLYIKTGRRRKKANQLDQIDREFLKKEIALQNRRWIPKVGRQKAVSSMEMGESTHVLMEQNRYDTLRDIQTVFQEHNKECVELGKGRIIQIGKINLIKDYM